MSEPAWDGPVWTEGHPGEGGGQGVAYRTAGAPVRQQKRRPNSLRLVAGDDCLVAGDESLVPRPAQRPRPAPPVRLTRRGRIVVTAAAVLTIGAVSMALAGAAKATGTTGPARPAGVQGKGLARVAVRPGQSLWSVAEAADPNADTRVVIQEIERLNSLTSDQVQPGQVLWVPRS